MSDVTVGPVTVRPPAPPPAVTVAPPGAPPPALEVGAPGVVYVSTADGLSEEAVRVVADEVADAAVAEAVTPDAIVAALGATTHTLVFDSGVEPAP